MAPTREHDQIPLHQQDMSSAAASEDKSSHSEGKVNDSSTSNDVPAAMATALELDEEISILGEVVCAHDLMKDDGNGSFEESNIDMNPFCIVSFAEKEIHRTLKSAELGTRNPFWTVSSRSLFLLKTNVRELAGQNDLEICIWTKQKDVLQLSTIDTIFLGKACISTQTILSNCNEQPLVVNLHDQDGGGSRGSLTMHFRLATPADEAYVVTTTPGKSLVETQSNDGSLGAAPPPRDISPLSGFGSFFGTTPSSTTNVTKTVPTTSSSQPSFLEVQQDKKDIVAMPTETADTKVAGDSLANAFSLAFKSKTVYDKHTSQQKILIKPHPDPHRPAETTYLSAAEIKKETMKPSQQWITAGSGTLGKLHLEILSCHDLPNLDSGESMGNLTDSFCTAVFEDAMVQTNVIDDCLSPHWLPWTQRAFTFGIMHPASMLYLGCFDFDLGISDNEPIGRVAVNISNFQRDTDYTLTYNLYPSSNVTDRSANGTLTIRLRVEYNDEKQALLAALKDRPVFHVNVKREKTLKVVHYTCFGEYGDENEEKFDLTVTKSYIQEILYYKMMISYLVGDVFRSLVFWRGQVKVMGLNLPVHSFLFFCAGATLVERPSMFPAFMILSVAWAMMAMGTKRQQHSSPWERGQSFWHYVEVLRTGRSHLRIRRIKKNEGFKEATAYEKQWTDRLAKDEDMANRQWELQQELDNLGSQNIHTQVAGSMIIPIELLGKLARWQGMIGRWIRKCRFIKIIVTWEESVVSFWFTACFLAAGLFSLLLPWAFILTWLGRGIVWGCLGPHMMFVDAYLQSDADDEKLLEKTMAKFKEDRLEARERYQQASKLKDLKSLMFGKYITLVPNYNLNRHCDRPLASSFARLHPQDESKSLARVEKKCIPGQQFFGIMIPRTQAAALEFEKEQPKLDQKLKALLLGIDRIHEEKHQKHSERREMRIRTTQPDSVGVELLDSHSAGCVEDKSSGRSPARDDDMSMAASVDLDEDSKTAVVSFFRESSTCNRQRESLRFGYELLSPGSTSNPSEKESSKGPTVRDIQRASSWPLVGLDERGEKEETGDGDGTHSVGGSHSMASFLKDRMEAMANTTGQDGGNGIEVVLRTIVEEDDSIASSHSTERQNDEIDELDNLFDSIRSSIRSSSDSPIAKDGRNGSTKANPDRKGNPEGEGYLTTRHGERGEAEMWNESIIEGPKDVPHSVNVSRSSGRCEIEARDGAETSLLDVAKRTEEEHDCQSLKSTKSSLSVVVLYQQD